MARSDAPAAAATGAARLEWTPVLAERFWRAAYARDLAPARWPRHAARHIAAILARRLPADTRAMILGDRDSEYAASLLLAGFGVGRLDTGPLLRGTTGQLAAHPAWAGNLGEGKADADLVLAPDLLACVMPDEIGPLFAAARASLRPNGWLAVTVPNSEPLDSGLSLCPKSGVLFHKDQHLRGFSPAALRNLLEREGLQVTAMLEAQPDELGFRALEIAGWMALSSEPRLHFGSGGTLLAIAVMPDPARPDDAKVGARWLASRRKVAETTLTPELSEWEWTGERVGDFWTRLAATPLNALSFGLTTGGPLLAALEPWLASGGRHLDIGAGEGEMARIMAEAGYAIAALEPSAGRRRMLAEKLRRAPAYIGGFEAIDGALIGSFDVAMAFEVVEHVLAPDLPAFFATFDRALAPGGRLIMSTPNREDMAASTMVSPETGVLYHRWQHLRAFDRDSFGALLTEHGFEVDVIHEIDAAAMISGASPYSRLVLARTEPVSLGGAMTLLAIAHRAGETPLPPRDPLALRSRIAPSVSKATVAATLANLPGGKVVQTAVRPFIKWVLPFARVVRPVARRVLPYPVKQFLVRLMVQSQVVEVESNFADRPVMLKDLPPLLDPEFFADGPIVLLNNSLAWGGAERQVVTTLKGLVARIDRKLGLLCLRLGEGPEYDFFLPAMADFPGFVRNTIKTAEARRILATAPAAAVERAMAAIKWMPADVRQEVECLAADFLQLRPAVVHAWQDNGSIAAAYAGRIVGVPKIIVSGRNMSAPNFAYIQPYMAPAYREIGSVTDIVMINNSAAGAADYIEWLGLPANRIQVLRNGVDPAAFVPPSDAVPRRLREELGIPEGVPVVGSIIRFNDEKRPLLWVETASLVAAVRPDCHFVIVGNGPLRAGAIEAGRRNGLADHLHCPGTSDEASAYLAMFDVLLLTSQNEGTPNVALEASLAGVPVVATEAGGAAEAIQEGVTGLVVRDDDPRTIAAHVLQVLDDPAWRERARAGGPRFVEQRFGLERMLQETLALYGL